MISPAPTPAPTPAPSPPATPATAPVTWLVLGDKVGDNAQVEVIAEALPWPSQHKRLVFRDQYVLGKPPFKPSLYHIDLDRSDKLAPPWPDLVITIGRRPSMAAMWIKAQSGGRTRVVLIGRPKRLLKQFDLILATPQYRLPDAPNVLSLDLPLMRVDMAAITEAGEAWRERLAALPRPLTAVLVGGPTKPFVFDAAVAWRLVSDLCRSFGNTGTLYVTTSRRTPEAVAKALAAALPATAKLFRWRSDAADNPYRGLLALADRFVVTGDSISMQVEVARLAKPLAIFPLPTEAGWWPVVRERLTDWLQPAAGNAGPPGPLAWLGDMLYAAGLIGYGREFGALHNRLIERGLAVILGQPLPQGDRPLPDDLPRVVARIKGLFANAGLPLA